MVIERESYAGMLSLYPERMEKESQLFRRIHLAFWSVLLLLLVGVSAGARFLHKQFEYQSAHADAINMSGRQRMLTAKVSDLARQLVLNQPTEKRDQARQHLRETARDLIEIHERLERRTMELAPALSELYHAGSVNIDQIHAYAVAAMQLAGAPESELTLASPDLRHIIGRTDGLIALFDIETSAWQDIADRSLENSHKAEIGLYVLVFATLLVLILAVFRPLVARLRQEMESLQYAETRTRLIVETAADGIITIDEQGTVDSFNTAAEQLFGYSREAVIGRNVKMLMPQPYHDARARTPRDLMRADVCEGIDGDGETMARRKDGTTVPIELRFNTALLNDESIYVGIVRDLSLQKEAEGRLRRYEQVVNAAGDLIVFVDRDYTYQLVNQSYLDVLGRPREEIIGQPVVSVVGTTFFNETLKPSLDRCLDGKSVRATFSTASRKSGMRWFDIQFVPYRDGGGELTGIVATGRDITELTNAMEKAKAANRAKSRFLASMSHELLTPLNHIIGYSEMLEEEAAARETAPGEIADLRAVRNAGKRLQELITEILELSNASAEPLLETTAPPADLGEPVERANPGPMRQRTGMDPSG